MADVSILIFVESRYQVNRKRIKATIRRVLDENKVMSACEVSVAVVGDRKMRALNKKYRDKDNTTNILSFPLAEGESRLPSDKTRFGDIILSYPEVIKDSVRDEMLVDDKIDFLLEHGMQHLLGIHHE